MSIWNPAMEGVVEINEKLWEERQVSANGKFYIMEALDYFLVGFVPAIRKEACRILS